MQTLSKIQLSNLIDTKILIKRNDTAAYSIKSPLPDKIPLELLDNMHCRMKGSNNASGHATNAYSQRVAVVGKFLINS